MERRPKFTRNNVLKLWKFLVTDLKALGAKKFYGKFSIGSINHVNIRTLQIILTKVCCMLGVIIYAPCAFLGISEPVLEEEVGVYRRRRQQLPQLLTRSHATSTLYHFITVPPLCTTLATLVQ